MSANSYDRDGFAPSLNADEYYPGKGSRAIGDAWLLFKIEQEMNAEQKARERGISVFQFCIILSLGVALNVLAFVIAPRCEAPKQSIAIGSVMKIGGCR